MGRDGAQNSLTAFHIELGYLIQEYLLDIELDADWESMTLVPCNSNNVTKQCLYLGRMGNNGAHSCTDTNCTKGKSFVSIYKLPEPNADEIYNGKASKVITLNINYSSGNFPTSRADSKSLFVVRHFVMNYQPSLLHVRKRPNSKSFFFFFPTRHH
jgi:hypothetical protein